MCRLKIALRAFLEQLTATGHHVEVTGPHVGTGPHASKHSSQGATRMTASARNGIS